MACKCVAHYTLRAHANHQSRSLGPWEAYCAPEGCRPRASARFAPWELAHLLALTCTLYCKPQRCARSPTQAAGGWHRRLGGRMEVLAAAVDQQENEERQQGSGGSPAPGGGTAAAAAARTRAAVQAEVQQEHAARIATEADGSLVAWTENVHEQVAAADATFLAARDAHQKVGGLGCRYWACCFAAAHASSAVAQCCCDMSLKCCICILSHRRRTLRALPHARRTDPTSAARARAQSGTPEWRMHSRWELWLLPRILTAGMHCVRQTASQTDDAVG